MVLHCYGVMLALNGLCLYPCWRVTCCSLYPLMRLLVAIMVLALPVLSTNQQEHKLFETM